MANRLWAMGFRRIISKIFHRLTIEQNPISRSKSKRQNDALIFGRLSIFPNANGGRGARVTGLRPYKGARQSEPGKPSKSAGAFTTSCGRNSGSSSPAGRRIWSGNGQGGGIVAYFRCPILSFHYSI